MYIANRLTGDFLYEARARDMRVLLGTAIQSRVKLEAADLKGWDLSGMRIENGDLRDSDFRGASFRNTVFRDCNLSGCHFGHTSLIDTKFERCVLPGAVFTQATGSNTQFLNCHMAGVSFYETDLWPVRFEGCHIQNSTWRRAYLNAAQFVRTGLRTSDFTGADLSGATFERCDLAGTRWLNTTLTGAVVAESCMVKGLDISGANCTGFKPPLATLSHMDTRGIRAALHELWVAYPGALLIEDPRHWREYPLQQEAEAFLKGAEPGTPIHHTALKWAKEYVRRRVQCASLAS